MKFVSTYYFFFLLTCYNRSKAVLFNKLQAQQILDSSLISDCEEKPEGELSVEFPQGMELDNNLAPPELFPFLFKIRRILLKSEIFSHCKLEKKEIDCSPKKGPKKFPYDSKQLSLLAFPWPKEDINSCTQWLHQSECSTKGLNVRVFFTNQKNDDDFTLWEERKETNTNQSSMAVIVERNEGECIITPQAKFIENGFSLTDQQRVINIFAASNFVINVVSKFFPPLLQQGLPPLELYLLRGGIEEMALARPYNETQNVRMGCLDDLINAKNGTDRYTGRHLTKKMEKIMKKMEKNPEGTDCIFHTAEDPIIWIHEMLHIVFARLTITTDGKSKPDEQLKANENEMSNLFLQFLNEGFADIGALLIFDDRVVAKYTGWVKYGDSFGIRHGDCPTQKKSKEIKKKINAELDNFYKMHKNSEYKWKKLAYYILPKLEELNLEELKDALEEELKKFKKRNMLEVNTSPPPPPPPPVSPASPVSPTTPLSFGKRPKKLTDVEINCFINLIKNKESKKDLIIEFLEKYYENAKEIFLRTSSTKNCKFYSRRTFDKVVQPDKVTKDDAYNDPESSCYDESTEFLKPKDDKENHGILITINDFERIYKNEDPESKYLASTLFSAVVMDTVDLWEELGFKRAHARSLMFQIIVDTFIRLKKYRLENVRACMFSSLYKVIEKFEKGEFKFVESKVEPQLELHEALVDLWNSMDLAFAQRGMGRGFRSVYRKDYNETDVKELKDAYSCSKKKTEEKLRSENIPGRFPPYKYAIQNYKTTPVDTKDDAENQLYFKYLNLNATTTWDDQKFKNDWKEKRPWNAIWANSKANSEFFSRREGCPVE